MAKLFVPTKKDMGISDVIYELRELIKWIDKFSILAPLSDGVLPEVIVQKDPPWKNINIK